MAIHIKELTIRAHVGDDGAQGEKKAGSAKKSDCGSSNDQAVKTAVEEVFRIMEDKKYR